MINIYIIIIEFISINKNNIIKLLKLLLNRFIYFTTYYKYIIKYFIL
jgi:hypothetical protein